ncbi:MAG: lysylphosphatidylglycerol synthase domain-containing protein, partial [Clostridia bacterium]
MKKKIFNIVIISTPFVMFFILIFKEGISSLIHQISRLNMICLVICLALIFLYWLFEAMALNVITGFYNIKNRIRESFSVTMVGQYFNSLTPFATGGQPAQVVYLHKSGIDLGNATAIVTLKFFIYQTVLTIYSAFVIFVSLPLFIAKIPLLVTMSFMGLAVHASMIIFTILF